MNTEAILIALYQKALIEDGWQWKERVYNDGSENNCYVRFSRNTHHRFEDIPMSEKKGWGRFPRVVCYADAYRTLVLGDEAEWTRINSLITECHAGLWQYFPTPPGCLWRWKDGRGYYLSYA